MVRRLKEHRLSGTLSRITTADLFLYLNFTYLNFIYVKEQFKSLLTKILFHDKLQMKSSPLENKKVKLTNSYDESIHQLLIYKG